MTETNLQATEHYNTALALVREGRLADARAHYEQAVALQPGYVRALHNLAVLLGDLGEHAAAEAKFREAIAADATVAEPWVGLGASLRQTGRLGEARTAYERALEIRPDFAAARWNLALIELAEGDFRQGWVDYLFRPSVDRAAVPLERLPENLNGVAIEVIDEQGLGDALFFARFVAELSRRGANVHYRPDPRLSGIVGRMLKLHEAAEGHSGLRVALADLPYLLGATECLLPFPVSALPSQLATAQMALRDAGPPPYIGVTWRAGQRSEGWLFKEAPLDALGRLLRNVPGTLIDLRRAPELYEHADLERAAGRRIADFSALNADLEMMLAILSLLDRYVGVSNTNMHLRAFAGRGADVLITNPAEYRWMASGESSPWFPGFALYRQAPDGSWDHAFALLAERLAP